MLKKNQKLNQSRSPWSLEQLLCSDQVVPSVALGLSLDSRETPIRSQVFISSIHYVLVPDLRDVCVVFADQKWRAREKLFRSLEPESMEVKRLQPQSQLS